MLKRTGTARRRRVDGRLILGIALIVASVVGTWFTVAAALPNQAYAVATKALLPGDVIQDGDLAFEPMHIPRSNTSYVSRGSDSVIGSVVSEPVGAGELVPTRSIGARDQRGLARIVVNSGQALPAELAPGSRVDLWHGSDVSNSSDDAQRLVHRAITVGVERNGGVIGASASGALEVLIPEESVAAVVEAEASGMIVVVQSLPGDAE